MKKIIILLIACIGFSVANTDAQTKKRKKHRTTKVVTAPTTTHYTMGKQRPMKEGSLDPVTVTGTNKSTNDNTTGVMGKEPVKNNAKGRYKNMNTNNSVELAPADGGNK